MIIYLNGYFRNWDYADKHTSRLRNKEVVAYRLQVLKFWNDFGLEAAMQYASDLNSRHGCSRATLYRWKKSLVDSGKTDRMGRCRLSAIDPKSTRPKRCRLPRDYAELYGPIKQLLEEHGMLGKNKIHRMLLNMVKSGKLILKRIKQIPSVSTIGRLVSSMRSLGRLPNRQRLTLNGVTGKLHVVRKKKRQKLRRDGYKPQKPGDLVQMDGVITYAFGRRVYILNAIDYVTSKAISVILPSSKSCYTAEVLSRIDDLFGFEVKHIQTDNGSEFMDRFEDMMDKLGKTHFYNYVKKPMWNGKVERFNRTLQEEWLSDSNNLLLIAGDKEKANEELEKYVAWYNNERPHQSIKYMTPNEYVLYLSVRGDAKKSQM